MAQIEIRGSMGELAVDGETGAVISYRADHEGHKVGDYSDIAKFDLEEWRIKYSGETCEGGDILDFGFWTLDGGYEEPAHDWRNDRQTQ